MCVRERHTHTERKKERKKEGKVEKQINSFFFDNGVHCQNILALTPFSLSINASLCRLWQTLCQSQSFFTKVDNNVVLNN